MNSQTRSTVLAICVALAAITWLVFGQTLRHDFVNYDDGEYVYDNPQVTPGLTREGIVWAFTRSHAANWHPLTWLSHMVDCQLFALRAGGHHFTNVLLHSATAIVLFLALHRMTAGLWRSAFVAAVFAVHPLRVESVAWISERKDLLSGLFFVLTIGTYLRYARAPSRGRYALVLLLFALGLMCKPMLVTVPLVLLLIDYWPLQRPISLRRAVLEKLPLLALSAASAVVTLFAQTRALNRLEHLSIPTRLANAATSTATYIAQMFWPSGLAPFYPLEPAKLTALRVVLSVLLVAGVSVFVFLLRRRRYLVTGWLWYLIMLAPVIGIVQVGQQAHADRYTYLPQIGLAIALTWGAADFVRRWRRFRLVSGGLAVATVASLAFAAHKQTAYWRESETLWNRTLAVTENNVIAEQNLGQALHQKGRPAEAIARLRRALAINPNQASVHSSLGVVLLETGRPNESLTHLEKAVELKPEDPDANYNLANTLMELGRGRDAVTHYRRALEGNPMDSEAMNNMAWVLATSPDPSTRDGRKAVELAERADSLRRGTSPFTNATLAAAYAEVGRFGEALNTARRALALATEQGNTGLADSIRAHIVTYEAGRPFRTAEEPAQ